MCFLLFQRDPERGWDRSKVKGLLANLITVRDVSYATGLEVVAGGRLYNIVVDTEVSGLEGRAQVLFCFFCASPVSDVVEGDNPWCDYYYYFFLSFEGDW